MSEYAQVTNNDGLITDVNREEGYATLTLNRPDRLNSLGSELLKSLDDSLKSVASDDSIRAIIITGAGRAFCSGADTDEMAGGKSDGLISLDLKGRRD